MEREVTLLAGKRAPRPYMKLGIGMERTRARVEYEYVLDVKDV